jgi:hypothetical protein
MPNYVVIVRKWVIRQRRTEVETTPATAFKPTQRGNPIGYAPSISRSNTVSKIMWKFKTKHFTVQWSIEHDVLITEYMDESLAKECRQNVRSGKWKCFTSEISVTLNASGVILGEEYLGGSMPSQRNFAIILE